MGVDEDVDKCLASEGKLFNRSVDLCGAIVEECLLEKGCCKYQRTLAGTNVCTYYLRHMKGGDEYGGNQG